MRKWGWRVSESEEGRGCEGGVHRLRESVNQMRKRRGVRGRDWKKRRVCERVWLEEEKVCKRAGFGEERGLKGWGWRERGVCEGWRKRGV